jgi:hypothetical protein
MNLKRRLQIFNLSFQIFRRVGVLQLGPLDPLVLLAQLALRVLLGLLDLLALLDLLDLLAPLELRQFHRKSLHRIEDEGALHS